MPAISLKPISFAEVSILDRRISVDDAGVQVWLVSLVADESGLACARSLLSPHELERASRFRARIDGERFALAHGTLRRLLGLYCRMRPDDIEFAIEADGKPHIDSTAGAPLAFNISHSADRMLVAVSGGTPVGVDIEAPGSRNDPVTLANRYFFHAEARDIEAAPVGARNDRFLQYWVAKEAVLKAAGLGLNYPLDALRIGFSHDRQRADVLSMQPLRLAPDFMVQMLDCGPGWHGAVAAPGPRRDYRPMPDYPI